MNSLLGREVLLTGWPTPIDNEHRTTTNLREGPGREVVHSGIADWSITEYLECADGKARPTKPGLHPLVDGIPGRVGQLRAYGNAIVPQVAAAFVQAFMEARR